VRRSAPRCVPQRPGDSAIVQSSAGRDGSDSVAGCWIAGPAAGAGLMYPLLATIERMPRGQKTRRPSWVFARDSAIWQSRTGQSSISCDSRRSNRHTLLDQCRQNPSRDFLASLAHLSDRTDAARAARFAGAGPQQPRRAFEQPRSQLEQRRALPDPPG